MKKAHQYSVELGDLAYASYSSYFVISTTFHLFPLEESLNEVKHYVEFLRACKYFVQGVLRNKLNLRILEEDQRRLYTVRES